MFADIKHFPAELRRRNPVLFYLGTVLLLLFLFMVIGYTICQYTLYELCHWVKAGKFTLSFALYALTFGWYMEYFKGYLSNTTLKWLTWALALPIILEMTTTFTQTWMTSQDYARLNIDPATTARWLNILSKLSLGFIILNTLAATVIGLQFFRSINVKPAAYLNSIRASFILFFISAMLGGFILHHYGPALPDQSSLGMPFSDISSTRNNLISLHFLGLHLLQILPFTVYYFQRYLGQKFLLATTALYSISSLFLMLYVKS